jgi:hypothetical protein
LGLLCFCGTGFLLLRGWYLNKNGKLYAAYHFVAAVAFFVVSYVIRSLFLSTYSGT